MRTGVIAKKIGMSSLYDDLGGRLTLTFLEIDHCQVIANKTAEKDGYNAVILGASKMSPNKVKKPLKSIFNKSKIEPRKIIKEFRVDSDSLLEIGTDIKADHFNVGQYVDVSAISIGKGFAGVMKRHNFAGLEASHGVSISHRSHGSTGGCQDPGKVFKNKKMAGQMGNKRVTIQNLQVVDVDEENNILIVSGNVPGSKGGCVFIKDAVKKSNIA